LEASVPGYLAPPPVPTVRQLAHYGRGDGSLLPALNYRVEEGQTLPYTTRSGIREQRTFLPPRDLAAGVRLVGW